MVRLEAWIGDYLAELAAANLTGRTIDTYRKALVRLVPELRAAHSDAELLAAIAGLASSTRSLYLSAARGFDAWCAETGRTPRRALAGRARVKLDKPAPKPFEVAELRQLGAAADPWEGRPRYAPLRARTRLLVVLLQESGIRIEDALALQWRDVVLDPGREGLHLRAPKGRQACFVPLEPGALPKALRAAQRDRAGRHADVAGGAAGGGRLGRGRSRFNPGFDSRWGNTYVLAVDELGTQPWSYRAALSAFQKLAETAGVEGATPHRMRHSRATELVARGVTTYGLQRAMTWAKLETASRYARYTDEQLRGELARLPPRR